MSRIKLVLIFLLVLVVSQSVMGGNRSSLDITPQPITKDPSLDGLLHCDTYNQKWNVTAASTGNIESISIGVPFIDVDAASDNPNCEVTLKAYTKALGEFQVLAKSSSTTSCVAEVTFCAQQSPSCVGGAVCNPGGSLPLPPTWNGKVCQQWDAGVWYGKYRYHFCGAPGPHGYTYEIMNVGSIAECQVCPNI